MQRVSTPRLERHHLPSLDDIVDPRYSSHGQVDTRRRGSQKAALLGTAEDLLEPLPDPGSGVSD